MIVASEKGHLNDVLFLYFLCRLSRLEDKYLNALDRQRHLF